MEQSIFRYCDIKYKNNYRFETTYSNYLQVLEILKELQKSDDKCIKFILRIDNNKYYECEDLINRLVESNYFIEKIEFGKKFNSTKYLNLKNLDGVKTVHFFGKYKSNLKDLPDNLENIIIKNTNNIEFIEIPFGLRRLTIFQKKSINYVRHHWYYIDFINMKDKHNKILLLNSSYDLTNQMNKYFEQEPNYIILGIYAHSDTLINIPHSIHTIQIFSSDNIMLEYLPNSVNRIIFSVDNNSSLINLPSSIKQIDFYNCSEQIINRLGQLPESIEEIFIEYDFISIARNQLILHMPNKLRIIKLKYTKKIKTIPYYSFHYTDYTRSGLSKIIEEYKIKNNLDFKITNILNII